MQREMDKGVREEDVRQIKRQNKRDRDKVEDFKESKDRSMKGEMK